MNYFYI